MAELDFVAQLAGPVGALVASASAAVVLWRSHVKEDTRREQRIADSIAERKVAEARLDSFRETMRDTTDVMERAVNLAEGIIGRPAGARTRSEDRRGRAR